MNGNAASRRELDTIFAGLKEKFGKVSGELSAYDGELKKHVEQLYKSTRQRSSRGNVREDHPLREHYAAIRAHIEQDCGTWLENLKKKPHEPRLSGQV